MFVPLARLKTTFSFGIEFGLGTIGCGFHIVNNWLVRPMQALISLVNDNQTITIGTPFLYVYFGAIVNSRPKGLQ